MKNNKVTAPVLVTSLAVIGCVVEKETVGNPALPYSELWVSPLLNITITELSLIK